MNVPGRGGTVVVGGVGGSEGALTSFIIRSLRSLWSQAAAAETGSAKSVWIIEWWKTQPDGEVIAKLWWREACFSSGPSIVAAGTFLGPAATAPARRHWQCYDTLLDGLYKTRLRGLLFERTNPDGAAVWLSAAKTRQAVTGAGKQLCAHKGAGLQPGWWVKHGRLRPLPASSHDVYSSHRMTRGREGGEGGKKQE